MRQNMQHETKAGGDAHELREAVRDLLGAFESFKDANDERLSQLEAKGAEDVVTVEKVERIDAALNEHKRSLDRLALEAGRPQLSGQRTGPVDEHKAAFERYVRTGDAAPLNALESKAFSAGVDADGGYLAPEGLEAAINARVRDVSPIRQIAGVRQIGSNVYRKPVATTDIGGGWVGETAARPETTTPTLSVVDIPTMELYAMPAATQALLDDSVIDLDDWFAGEIQSEFAQQEGTAFVAGDGVNKPKGILGQTIVAENLHSWGEIGYVATGVAGAFPVSNPADILIDLIHTPRQMHRANGSFLMSRGSAGAIRKFKDADGNYIWQPGLAAGQPATLFGFPVHESEDMPAIAADSFSIAFGDFERGYLIVDRVGVRVLRDPYSAKPFVLFYTTKRVGGDVQNFDAIKLLKFGLS